MQAGYHEPAEMCDCLIIIIFVFEFLALTEFT